MFLPGRLERSTLGDVLGQLHRARATGHLELALVEGSAAGGVRRVHLWGGRVVGVDGDGPRIGELLAALGTPRWGIERALDAEPGAGLAGEQLLRRGLVGARELGERLAAQAIERLEALFRLRRAELRFRVAQPRRATAVPVELAPAQFLHGRPRRVPRGAPPPPPKPAAPFAELGLEPGASADEVRRAFRRRAGALHPDRARDETARRVLERALARLTESYHAALAGAG